VAEYEEPVLFKKYDQWMAQPWWRRTLPWWWSLTSITVAAGRLIAGAHDWPRVGSIVVILLFTIELLRDLRRRRRVPD